MDEEPEPYEFATPGYPETPAAAQVPMPLELPGYPTQADFGPVVIPAALSDRALVIPPPPPPPRMTVPADVAPEAPVAPAAYAEPIRLDLPMSAVLAREFTRTTPWESGQAGHTRQHTHSAAAAPSAPEVAVPAAVIQTAPVVREPVQVEPPIIEPVVASSAVIEPVVAAIETAPFVAPDTSPDPLSTEPKSASTNPKRIMTIIGLGALLALVAAAAAFFLPGILNPTDTPDAGPSASSAPTTSPSAVTPTTVATAGFVLQTPTTVGPYTKMSGPIDLSLKAAMTASVIPGLTNPVTAVYGTDKTPHATVIAWHAPTPPAATSVAQAFAGFQTSSKTVVSNISGVSSTGLPGQMSCGETTINATPTTLCFWADPSTFGSVTVISPKTPAEGALTAAQIRSAVEVQQ